MANLNADYIEWADGLRPVESHVRVIPQFRSDRDAKTAERAAQGEGVAADAYSWEHDGGPTDIIAYRLVRS